MWGWVWNSWASGLRTGMVPDTGSTTCKLTIVPTASPKNGGTVNATREQFSAFDSADYLSSLEDAAAYLEASLEDGDSSDVPRVLGAIVRSGNISELARRGGMSREGLYKALSAEGNPSFDTVVKVSPALGLQLHFEATA